MQKTGTWVLGLLLLLTAGSFATAGAQYGPPGPPPGGGWDYRGGPGSWDASWDRRPFPNRGACFFTDAGFQGHRFCVNAGDRIERLPGNIGDKISSIQVFGRANVRVFDDRNFQGMNASFGRSVADLSRVPSRPGHTWNDRISSVAVR